MAKIGIEVEGRFIGLHTLFIDAATESYMLKDCNLNVQQIYISDNDNLLKLDSELIKDAADNFIITIERTYLPHEYPEYINIMLSISNNSPFFRLHENDQVKFSWQQTVYAITKRNMTKTIPSDFDGDVTL